MESLLQSVIAFGEWFGMDLSPQTLLKCAILTALLVGLLLVIALLYRGEMQNRDIIGVLKEFVGDSRQSGDLVFARRTLDIKAETTSADVAIYVTFQVRVGESTHYRRRKVYSGAMRLRMRAYANQPIGEGDFGVHPERHTRIAKRMAECEKAELARAQRLATPFWEQVPIIKHLIKLPAQPYEVSHGETAIRLAFPINPVYLLTAHPDREVKASAWLTLLTSFFAVVMQIFFGGGPRPADVPERAPHVRTMPPQT